MIKCVYVQLYIMTEQLNTI